MTEALIDALADKLADVITKTRDERLASVKAGTLYGNRHYPSWRPNQLSKR